MTRVLIGQPILDHCFDLLFYLPSRSSSTHLSCSWIYQRYKPQVTTCTNTDDIRSYGLHYIIKLVFYNVTSPQRKFKHRTYPMSLCILKMICATQGTSKAIKPDVRGRFICMYILCPFVITSV